MAADKFDIPHSWEEPEELHLLLQDVRERLPDANVRRIRFAYLMAEEAHSGQFRSSGEPYVTHPLAVAKILSDLGADEDTLIAAILHDAIEDTGVTAADIADKFGPTVSALVEGVTKLKFRAPAGATTVQRTRAETTRAAETLRKMLLAMAEDFRVIVIKLADRLHNMQTLEGLAPEKRTRIASETLDVFAPLAARMGIWQIKWQLEDLAFKHLHPNEFQRVSELVAKSRRDRESELQNAIVTLKERLAAKGVTSVEIQGRPKHLYSIFGKMVKQGIGFDEIYDLLALRIVVPKDEDCYVALMVVHDLWVPIPGLFSDYIAKPKPNGYQSLHTKVIGPSGGPLEIQIRTAAMHDIAEHGVAAHWTYKEGEAKKGESNRFTNLRQQVVDWSSESKIGSDFLRSLRTDLFSEQVFVFTPKGDVLDLPKESTPVDFAFRVHTKLGLTTIGAKVNGQMVPLSTALKNGDVVELVTRANAQPSLDWLEFVKSSHTRNKLRAHFRKQSKFEDAERGRSHLERELKSSGLDPKQYLGEEKINEILPHYHGAENAIDLFAKVGSGLVSAHGVVQRLKGSVPDSKPADAIQVNPARGKLTVSTRGLDDVLVKRAKCCDPVPGDEVVGYISRGRGIIVHRKICPNALAYESSDAERLVPLDWPADGSSHSVVLQIITMNRQGLLMDISTIFGEAKANVSAARIRTLPNQTAEIQVTIEVVDIEHLSQVMTKIGNFSDVISILRLFGKSQPK